MLHRYLGPGAWIVKCERHKLFKGICQGIVGSGFASPALTRSCGKVVSSRVAPQRTSRFLIPPALCGIDDEPGVRHIGTSFCSRLDDGGADNTHGTLLRGCARGRSLENRPGPGPRSGVTNRTSGVFCWILAEWPPRTVEAWVRTLREGGIAGLGFEAKGVPYVMR